MRFGRRTSRILLPSTLSCQVEIDARSSKPRDVPVFARRPANARIAGMYETVFRGHANALDPDRLSAGWARRNHPPDSRPGHGGDVTASGTSEIEHLAGDR